MGKKYLFFTIILSILMFSVFSAAADDAVYLTDDEFTAAEYETVLRPPRMRVEDIMGGKQVYMSELNSSQNSVHYTLDGSEPTAESELYTEPVKITASGAVTVRAVSVTPEGEVSDRAEETVLVQRLGGKPEISYDELNRYITISGDGTQIFFTTDGSDPTPDSMVYSDELYPVGIHVDTVPFRLKTVMAAEGYAVSEAAEYSIDTAVVAVDDNIIWTVDKNGLLIVSGSGEMKSNDALFSNGLNQWYGLEKKISNIIVGSGITKISNGAFKHCVNAELLKIGGNVTSVGEEICSVNTKIDYAGSFKKWLTITNGLYYGSHTITYGSDDIPKGRFSGGAEWRLEPNGSFTVYGNGSVDSYASFAETPWSLWKDYVKRLYIEAGVKNIGSHAFTDCGRLESVYLKSGIADIGGHAFENASGLADVFFEGDVSKWAEVTVGNGNAYFSKAKYHYLAAKFGDIEITGSRLNAGNVYASFHNRLSVQVYFTVLCASYKNGALCKIQMKGIDLDKNDRVEICFDDMAENGCDYKIFAWSDTANPLPLCAAKSF